MGQVHRLLVVVRPRNYPETRNNFPVSEQIPPPLSQSSLFMVKRTLAVYRTLFYRDPVRDSGRDQKIDS